MAKKRSNSGRRGSRSDQPKEKLSRTTLLWRAGVVGLGLAASYFAFADAVVGITRTRNPAIALRLDGGDPGALNTLAELALVEKGKPDIRHARDLAFRSVEEAALNPAALRTLGFTEDASGKSSRAEKLIELAQRMSRRDAATQLWLIERDVRRNDIPAVLSHYDTLLRTSRSKDGMLFPLLDAALAQPEIRKGFAPYVKSDPLWMSDFVGYVVDFSKSPEVFAEAAVAAGGLPADPEYRRMESMLLRRLSDRGRIDTFIRFLHTIEDANPGILRLASLSPATLEERYAPAAWDFPQKPTIGSTMEEQPRGTTLTLFAGPSEKGIVARKLLLLSPGRYRLTSRLRLLQRDSGSSASFLLRCAEQPGAPAIWQSRDLLYSGNLSADLSIDGSCKGYFLEIEINGGGGQTGAEVSVDGIRLEREAVNPLQS